MHLLQTCVLCTFLSIVLFSGYIPRALGCALGCTCTTIPRENEAVGDEEDGDLSNVEDGEGDEFASTHATRGRKVSCSNNPYPFASIDDVKQAITIPLDTIYLDLSKNEITIIKKASFSTLSYLQRLDLSENQISLIEPGAFEGLSQLQRLDLSKNKLGSVNSSIFTGLPKLEKLVLSFNKLNTVPDGTFNELPSLKRLDFQSDYLRCDCHLQWIVNWSKDRKVKIRSSTMCAVPRDLQGSPVKKLKRKDLHCDRPLELPFFEIVPGTNQIVFEGDKIPLECQAAIVDPKTQMFWLRRNRVVETNRSQEIFVHTRRSPDNTMMMHSLVLVDLKKENSGEWDCLVSTPQGNVSKTVFLRVINSQATQCEKNTTKTNKGLYIWKETVAGLTVDQPCKLGEGKVTHHCDSSGHWSDLNLAACEFTNELTRKLQTLAEDTNSSKILADARALERLVSAPFRNDEDPLSTINSEYVDFASLTIYRLSQHADLGEEIVKSVLLSASRIMNISTSILNEAQRKTKSLTRISQAVESIPRQVASKDKYSQSSQLIIIETRSFPRQQFPGMQCSRLDLKLDMTVNKLVQDPPGFVFVCNQPSNTDTFSYLDTDPLTSVLVPKSILRNPTPTVTTEDNITTTTRAPDNSRLTFQFIWYANANLFPMTTSHHDDPVLRGKTWVVISAVLSVSLSEPVSNLSEPIEIVFEIPPTDSELTAAYWDYTANDDNGDWRTDGCIIVDRRPTLATVHCDHLTAFAVLKDLSPVRTMVFHMMAMVVYIGSCVCLLCLMAVIITYVSCFKFLNVPRKMKHSIINICLSLLLLIIAFTMGVQRVDHERACQAVGISLHYLSMVTLFWFTVTARAALGIIQHYLFMVTVFWFTVTACNMLKKFRKKEHPPPPPMDVIMPMPPKPIIRFYLLAWGVPSIICGITAAISFEFYSEINFCFLDWEPSLGAFFGPVAFLLLLNAIFYLRTACIIHSSTGPLLSAEELQELQSNDIEMTGNMDQIETQSIDSEMSTKSSVTSNMDCERRPITQLRALALCLILFIFTWMFGAITVAKPFTALPYQDIMFSYLYGIFCAILGLFMLIYFCLTRKDSRLSWKRFFMCEQQAVLNAAPVNVTTELMPNGHINMGSVSDISKVTSAVVSNHVMTHIIKSDDELSSIHLVPSKPTSAVDGSTHNNSINEASAASFYNPKQNGVAKKFWEKKNKHNSKLLSKEMTKSLNINHSDSDFSSSEHPRAVGLGYNSDHGNPGQQRADMDSQVYTNGGESDCASALSPTDPQPPPSYNSVMTHLSATAQPLDMFSEASYHGGNPNMHHSRTHSSSSLGNRNHSSAFSVVPPRNNTLPKQGITGRQPSHSMPSSPEREMQENTVSVLSSVARLGDFDGSSQVSSNYSHERMRSPRPGDPQVISGYCSPALQGSFYKQYGPIDGQPAVTMAAQQNQTNRNRVNSGGNSSDSSSRHRKQMENNFIQQVEQRIPQVGLVGSLKPVNHLNVNGVNHVVHKPPISPVSDSDNNGDRTVFPDSDSQVNYNKPQKQTSRPIDSDHNSEPASKSHKNGGSRVSRKNLKQGMTKQRSLDWDEQFADSKSQSHSVPYAYVNHNYTERVLQKLTDMALSEHIDPKSKAFWVPRSSRSYNQLVQKEKARLCEDSSNTSSDDDDDDDDSLDNIWVLQKEKRAKKNKKETSV